MDELLQFAAKLGVHVVVRDLGRRKGEYRHRAGLIALSPRLSDAQSRSTLAHELGHAWYCDDAAEEPLTVEQEHRATAWAARRLIQVTEYAAAERIAGPHAGAIARELCVTRDLVLAWQATRAGTSSTRASA